MTFFPYLHDFFHDFFMKKIMTFSIPYQKSILIFPFSGTTPLQVMGRIFDLYQKLIPAYLDQRISGVDSAKFAVNSRILSFSISPPPADPTALKTHPIRFSVEHTQPQGEMPFQKGAILCAYWNYNSTSSSGDGTKCVFANFFLEFLLF